MWPPICGTYQASTALDGDRQLEEFARKWDGQYPTVSQIWRRNWERITPFFGFLSEKCDCI